MNVRTTEQFLNVKYASNLDGVQERQKIGNLLLTEIMKSLSSIPMVSGLSSNLSFDL